MLALGGHLLGGGLLLDGLLLMVALGRREVVLLGLRLLDIVLGLGRPLPTVVLGELLVCLLGRPALVGQFACKMGIGSIIVFNGR